MKKHKMKNNLLYKVVGKIDGISYFTILTQKQIDEKDFMFSPNKDYFFVLGNKIQKDCLTTCALSVRVSDFQIIEAQELPERENFNFCLEKEETEFEKFVNQMIQNNLEFYDEVDLEK